MQESQFTSKTTSQSGICDEFVTRNDAGLLLESSDPTERSFSHNTPPCLISLSFISE